MRRALAHLVESLHVRWNSHLVRFLAARLFFYRRPGHRLRVRDNIARWIWSDLKPRLPGLSRSAIRETFTSGCVYTGE